MDHHAEHHERHEKEREHHKKELAAYERAEEKSTLLFHRAWLAVAGIVLTLLVVLVWTFLI